MGVVYHANYLIWCELGRTDFIRMLGKPYSEFERDGVRLAVSDVTMRFKGSAKYDDPIRVHTTITEVRSRAVTFAYRIEQPDRGEILVTAATSLIALDVNARPITMPVELRKMLASAIADTES